MVRVTAGTRKQFANAIFESFVRRVPEAAVLSKPVRESIEFFAVLHVGLPDLRRRDDIPVH